VVWLTHEYMVCIVWVSLTRKGIPVELIAMAIMLLGLYLANRILFGVELVLLVRAPHESVKTEVGDWLEKTIDVRMIPNRNSEMLLTGQVAVPVLGRVASDAHTGTRINSAGQLVQGRFMHIAVTSVEEYRALARDTEWTAVRVPQTFGETGEIGI
jgi:hypothetical protein